MVSLCFIAADESSIPATLPEISQTDASATNEAVGFTVLGEVKPRSLKKVFDWPFSVSGK